MLEELKLILETLESLGDYAYYFAIGYLIKEAFGSVLIFVGFVVAIKTIYLIASRIADCISIGPKVAAALNHRVIGSWGDGDTQDIIQEIRKLMEKNE